MTFKPTTKQLETIAELGHARASSEQIAAALGITEAEFSAWAGRLVAARAAGMPVLPPGPAARALTPEPKLARIVAERLFEGDSATDGIMER